MLKKDTIKKINNWIAEGFEKRDEEDTKACCNYFIKAWETLHENAPESYLDFTTLVAEYNQGESDYDWGGWIWELGEELGVAGKEHPECMEHRIEFIETFKARFPETSDEELMEYLQRSLIKTYFLIGKDEAGEQAVRDFYKKIDYSVWGYIEWADALIKRRIVPSKAVYENALAIYKKGLGLDDDPEFLDTLKARIEKTEKLI